MYFCSETSMNKEKFGFFELTVPIAEILSGARAHGSQWFSHKMNGNAW